MNTFWGTLQKKFYNNRAKIKVIYLMAALFSCFITLRLLSGQVSESVRMLCYLLCIAAFLKSDDTAKRVGQVFRAPWEKAVLFLLEFCGTFSMTGMYFLWSTVPYAVQVPKIIYLMLSFCWIRPVVRYILGVLLKMGDAMDISEQTVTWRMRLLLIGIIMVPCMVFLIAFNPAITSPDSEYCFEIAHRIWQPDVGMGDWHPPFYIFIINLLLRIWDSISFLVAVQCLCFATVFTDGILFLYKCGLPKKILAIVYLFMAFNISNTIQLVTFWKDIPYMISLLWLTLLMMKFVMRHDEYAKNPGWYAQFVIAVVFTGFFRQNGILAALAVIVFLPAVMKFKKKLVVSGVLCLMMIAMVKGPLYRAMGVTPVPQLKFFSMANDMMLSYYSGCPMSPESMEVINKITQNDPDNFGYSAYWVNYNGAEPSGYAVMEFLKIYLENMIRNPKSALMAVASRNSVIWSVVKPSDEPAGCVNYLGEQNTMSPNIYPFRSNNLLTRILTYASGCITGNSILYLFYWRTGIYNLLFLFMAATAFCFNQKKKLLQMMPYVPVVANLAALFISSGWTDYRYYWPSMVISPFLLCFFLFSRKQQTWGREVTAKNI